MKVIALNGSPRKDGNTAAALRVMAAALAEDGIDTEVLQVGGSHVHGCIACGYCWESENNLCVFKDDIVNDHSLKMRAADGLILASPTYYAGIPGDMKSFLDRVFFSGSHYFRYKVGTAVSVVRRAGGVDVVHQLMNFFNLAETVTPPSQYWTVAYGMEKGEALLDLEGIQTLRKNARAMAWLLRLIEAGRDTVPLPPEEPREIMNFIRK